MTRRKYGLLFLLAGFSLLFLLYCKYSAITLAKSGMSVYYLSKTEDPSSSHNAAYRTQISSDPAFNLPLNPEKKIILLLTSFRCGSTFLGQIFDSNPRMQYLFEPFHESLMRNLYKKDFLIGARADHTLSDLRMLYLQQIMPKSTKIGVIP